MEQNNASDEGEVTLIPIYKFEWADGTVRDTSTLLGATESAVESLAQFGREDPECTVSVTGYMR